MRRSFTGCHFKVTRDVLIPRPETEHLVEKVLSLAANFEKPRIVDVGTGSGAIAVALAHKLPDAQITAIDISAAALAVARGNAERNGVAERIRFLEGDLLAPVAGEEFEIVVSNPPYVAESDRESLAVEVRDYEPAVALFAGEDGLDIYRRLIPDARMQALVAGGLLALEIGYGQDTAVAGLLAKLGFGADRIHARTFRGFRAWLRAPIDRANQGTHRNLHSSALNLSCSDRSFILLRKETSHAASKGYAAPNAQSPLAPFDFTRREPGATEIAIEILLLRCLPLRSAHGSQRMGTVDLSAGSRP